MEESFLKDFNAKEKCAYIGTIASLAIADNVAVQEEIDTIHTLADAAGISGLEKEKVLKAAKGISDEEFDEWLDILKTSELRFSLVTELINFARTDGQYTDQEKAKIEEISTRLGINSGQYAVLDNFVTKSNESMQAGGEPPKQGFLESLGMGNVFEKAGISMPGLGKGLLAVAAPFLLAKLFGGRKGALSGMLKTAGLTSLLGLLSGGRGFGKTGGLLSKFLHRR